VTGTRGGRPASKGGTLETRPEDAMADEAPFLESLKVAAPCPADWEQMKGDARVRHCGSCRLNVYNLSAMTRREAEALVRRTEGRLCVRFYRRADGTVLTADCPVGLAAVRRRIALLGGALAAMLVAMFTAGCARSSPTPTTGAPVPTTGKPVMGDVAGPPALQGEVCLPDPK